MATQYTAGLTTGQVLTAATMNSIGAAWETFNPTITQGATPTKTHNVRYARIQKIVHYQGLVQFSSAGTAANIIACNLPVTAVAVTGTFMANGSALFYDGSTNRTYTMIATLVGATSMQFWYDNTSNFFGAQPAITIANTDWLSFNVTYEGQ
jgi:hypothetical protein